MKKILALISIVFMAYSCSSSDDGNNDGDPMTCNAPTGITISSTTTNSASINWSSNEDNATFEIQYGQSGFSLGNGTSINYNNSNATINNLMSNTAYQVYVRTNCGTDGFSDWSGPSSFTTQVQTCAAPTDLQVFNVTDNSATLVWFSNEGSATFDVEYGISGFGIGNGTVITTSNNNIELTGLLSTTQYEYYVRTNCSNSNTSDYAGPTNFTTDANCSMPLSLQFFNLQSCAIEIAWNSNNETAWQVEYGDVGFTIGNGTVINTSNTNIVITDNLAPSTTYEIYVRANCGSNGFSAYTDALVVTTNPIDESFFIGDYLIQDVTATIGPGNGTENFATSTVNIDIDSSDPNKRIFFAGVLPAFNPELEEIILQINADGSIALSDVVTALSCDGGVNTYNYISAGSNNTVVSACGDSDFIVINYIEDSLGSCGGPYNSSFSLTKQ